MKNLLKQNGAVITIAMIAVIGFTFAALSLTGCDDGGGGGTETLTYKGKGATNTYTLTIAKTAARAFTPIAGDKFELTNGTNKSRGTVDYFDGTNFTLQPADRVAPTLQATVSGKNLTGLSGTITFTNGTSVYVSETLTPVTPGGGGPGLTITGIPAEYNGMYMGADIGDLGHIFKSLSSVPGRLDDNSGDIPSVKIVNGTATFYVVEIKDNFSVVSYSGSDAISIDIYGIAETKITESYYGAVTFINESKSHGFGNAVKVQFTKGSGALSFNGIAWKGVKPVITMTWAEVTNFPFSTTDYINAIAYGNNKFVAGDYNGKIATSTDGVNWTLAAETIFSDLSVDVIAYDGGKFIAAGHYSSDRRIATSTDGVNWTAVTDSVITNISISGIVCGNGMFVAAGYNGKVAYSTNGISWTAADSTFGTSDINGIAFGNGKFVIVGPNGRIAASSDGVTWTKVETSLNSGNIEAIAFGSGKFVLCSRAKMAYSTDGTAWTGVTSSVNNNLISDLAGFDVITYGGGMFAAGQFGGEMAYSNDGVNWVAAANPIFDDDDINAIGFGGGKFIVGGYGKMAYTTNIVNVPGSGGGQGTAPAITTTTLPGGTVGSAYNQITLTASGSTPITWSIEGGALPTGLSLSSSGIISGTPSTAGTFTFTVKATNSADSKTKELSIVISLGGGSNGSGIKWTVVNSPFDNQISDIAFGNNTFVAGDYNGKIAYSKDNGKTWTVVPTGTGAGTSTFGDNVINGIAYGNNTFVAVGTLGKIAYSKDDGKTWTAVTNSTFIANRNIQDIAFGNNTFVAVGFNQIGYSKDDGKTWKQVTNTNYQYNNLFEIAYGNDRFVAGGDDDNKIVYSTDGETWTSVTLTNSPPITSFRSIAFGNGTFVAGIDLDTIAYSSNGETWTPVKHSSFGWPDVIVYGNNKFIAVQSELVYSTDNGKTWTAVTGRLFEKWPTAIAFGNGTFVAVGLNGEIAYSSGN
jgi:hypothetical protein